MQFSWSLQGSKSAVTMRHVSIESRDGPRAAATSKVERFVIIVNGFQPLTIITKRSILDVAAALDLPLELILSLFLLK